MQPLPILGFDISTYCGCVALGPTNVPLEARLLTFPDKRGWFRVQAIAQGIRSFLDQVGPVEAAVIEGYAYGNMFTIVKLVELGTMVRQVLYEREIQWWTVAPTTLKKWTTGAGNAPKAKMAQAVKDRWWFESAAGSSDIVDAYALAQMGREILSKGKENFKGVESWT